MEIINTNFVIDIYGFSEIAINKDYVGTAFKLMDRMWQTIKPNNIKNKGQNIFVYDDNDYVFAGVELSGIPENTFGLEQKSISLSKYAYHKHIGSYNLIKQTGQNMRSELQKKNLETYLPYIEIYGHWTNDESKQETELLMSLK